MQLYSVTVGHWTGITYNLIVGKLLEKKSLIKSFCEYQNKFL